MPRLELPERFSAVPYSATCVPGKVPLSAFATGANCQLFSYALLAHYGLEVPPWRSSDLWVDTRASRRVTQLEPLDLLLWNKAPDAYGAHVGVYLGEGRAAHLSRQVGRPTVWALASFLVFSEYHVFIGAKRMTRRNAPRFATVQP
jgi:lipoprotein Spr